MKQEEHAVKIREAADLILRCLAAQNFAEIVPLLDEIKEHSLDIQTNR